MAKIHKWSRLQFLMLECKSWFETVHTRSTNENTICFCRKGIYKLMVESLPFYSAGGSSVLMLYICVGLVLSVYTHNTKKLFG